MTNNVRAPSGSMTYATSVSLKATAVEACSAATDLKHLRRIEPRILEARWTDQDAPRSGSRVDITTEIRFHVPWVRRAVGRQHGVVTLVDYQWPKRLVCELETERGRAHLVVEIAETREGCKVIVTGWILPRRLAHRVGLSALAKPLRPRVHQAIRRMIVLATEPMTAPAVEDDR